MGRKLAVLPSATYCQIHTEKEACSRTVDTHWGLRSKHLLLYRTNAPSPPGQSARGCLTLPNIQTWTWVSTQPWEGLVRIINRHKSKARKKKTNKQRKNPPASNE